jgi:hypothetical protein
MCGPTTTAAEVRISTPDNNMTDRAKNDKAMAGAPVEMVHQPPSLTARYSCALGMVAVFGVWSKICFVDEATAPTIGSQLHGPIVPAVMTAVYLAGLPLLRHFSKTFLSEAVDVKLLLKETMIIYNAGQVLLNAWMVYRFIDALLFRGHPFIGDIDNVTSGATFAVYIHYMDKYLEFFDTIFMVVRGRMDQVRFSRQGSTVCFFSLFFSTVSFRSGFLPSCLPPRFDRLGMVVCSLCLAGWRCLFRSTVQFPHPCDDVFLLHFEFV